MSLAARTLLKKKSRFLCTIVLWLDTQSKYPVLHSGAFGGTGFLFLGHLGSLASTEKKFGADYEQFLRAVFSCLHNLF
jgi:hypothetical protein